MMKRERRRKSMESGERLVSVWTEIVSGHWLWVSTRVSAHSNMNSQRRLWTWVCFEEVFVLNRSGRGTFGATT